MAAAWDTVAGQQSASLQKRFGRTLDRGADIVADVVEIIEENGYRLRYIRNKSCVECARVWNARAAGKLKRPICQSGDRQF